MSDNAFICEFQTANIEARMEVRSILLRQGIDTIETLRNLALRIQFETLEQLRAVLKDIRWKEPRLVTSVTWVSGQALPAELEEMATFKRRLH